MGVTVHPLARRAVTYLAELGFPATEPNRHRGKALPYHLADAFELVTLEIAGQPVLLAIDQGAERSPAEIEQLMRKLDEMVETTAVYVTEILNSYDRKRLIERRVSFLVPRKQLYLPGLGMDLREHFGKPIERNQLSPSAQAMLIAILQHPSWTVELTATEVAEKLDYTPMTASRAARELAAAGLAELEKAPKGQIIALNRPPRDTWELALPHMQARCSGLYTRRCLLIRRLLDWGTWCVQACRHLPAVPCLQRMASKYSRAAASPGTDGRSGSR